jgi:hypothetical protein
LDVSKSLVVGEAFQEFTKPDKVLKAAGGHLELRALDVRKHNFVEHLMVGEGQIWEASIWQVCECRTVLMGPYVDLTSRIVDEMLIDVFAEFQR